MKGTSALEREISNPDLGLLSLLRSQAHGHRPHLPEIHIGKPEPKPISARWKPKVKKVCTEES